MMCNLVSFFKLHSGYFALLIMCFYIDVIILLQVRRTKVMIDFVQQVLSEAEMYDSLPLMLLYAGMLSVSFGGDNIFLSFMF